MASSENPLQRLFGLNFYRTQSKWKLASRERFAGSSSRENGIQSSSESLSNTVATTSKEDCKDSDGNIKLDEVQEPKNVCAHNAAQENTKQEGCICAPESETDLYKVEPQNNVGKVVNRLHRLYELSQMTKVEDQGYENQEKPDPNDMYRESVLTVKVEVYIDGESVLIGTKKDNINWELIEAGKKVDAIDGESVSGEKDEIDGGSVSCAMKINIDEENKLQSEKDGNIDEESVLTGEEDGNIEVESFLTKEREERNIEGESDQTEEIDVESVLSGNREYIDGDSERSEDKEDLEWDIPIHSQYVESDGDQARQNDNLFIPDEGYWRCMAHRMNCPTHHPNENTIKDSIQYWIDYHVEREKSFESFENESSFMRGARRQPCSSEYEMSLMSEDELGRLTWQQLANEISHHSKALHMLVLECSMRIREDSNCCKEDTLMACSSNVQYSRLNTSMDQDPKNPI